MSTEDFLDIDFTDFPDAIPLDRREFLKLSGTGIFILFFIGDSPTLAQEREYPEDLNAYLRIGEDGRVTCYTGKIEMGQGVVTSLAQELAEELDVSLDSVDMVMGDTDLCPYDRGTWGSRTTRFFGPALREAGAKARAVLIELAAEHLGVSKDRLKAENGAVYYQNQSKEKVTYAQLAKGKKIVKTLTVVPDVKKPSEFKIISKPFNRRDALEKVTGEAKFAGDIRFPGMLYARILRPPAHEATLKSVDVSAAENIHGVRVVQQGDLIAVLHERPDEAERAHKLIKAEYDVPKPRMDDKTIFDHLLKVASEEDIVEQGGDLAKGENRASSIIEETYLNSYVAHATIETHTAVAKIDGEKITVWASTQTPFGVKAQVAQALNVPPENVRVITPFVGGGFGGKSPSQQAIEAVRLAKLAGVPVQVVWTRSEEFFFDSFRPAAVVKIKSGLTDTGGIAMWDYHVYFAGSRGSRHFYDIPHHRTVSHGVARANRKDAHPFATGAWRAPANNTNSYARESHIDMMAAKAGIDPVEFRLKNLKDERFIRVLKAAADAFGWTPAKAPSGRGFGVALGTDVGTCVAVIAQVAVDDQTGRVDVKRAVCAQDMGLVINPEGAKIQIEGCINMGLGYALTEEIHFEDGKIFDENFDTYAIPRFSWSPKIEAILIEDKNSPPQGGGEPAIIVMGGVIANSVFDAAGARLYQLPMTPERIKEALAKS